MSFRTSSASPTILSDACLREINALGKEAEKWMDGALEIDSERSMDSRLQSPETLQRLRNTYATLKRAVAVVEAVGKKYQREVNRMESDLQRAKERSNY